MPCSVLHEHGGEQRGVHRVPLPHWLLPGAPHALLVPRHAAWGA